MGKCASCKVKCYASCHGCNNWDYRQFLKVGDGCDDYSNKVEAPDYTTAMELNKRIDSLRGELLYTRNKINQHIEASGKKRDRL